jgi:hypothetical protein
MKLGEDAGKRDGDDHNGGVPIDLYQSELRHYGQAMLSPSPRGYKEGR